MKMQEEIEGQEATEMRGQRARATLPPTTFSSMWHARITIGLSHTTYDTIWTEITNPRSAACPNEIKMETHYRVPPTANELNKRQTKRTAPPLGPPDPRK